MIDPFCAFAVAVVSVAFASADSHQSAFFTVYVEVLFVILLVC